MTILANFRAERIRVPEVTLNVALGGGGPPLLLLHGYPQTHAMWHKIAPSLAADFTVIAPDLRGYGDSDKPPGDPEHVTYSKRAMARDVAELMTALGFERFAVAGHDRGARVTHRLCLDYPERVTRAAVLDIVPTSTMFATADKEFGDAYYHWFFLSQPYDLPERLIGADPEYYLRAKIARWSRNPGAFTEAALAEYLRCFRDPATIHATCEDYRAAASIDLVHDAADLQRRLACPLLVLWGVNGFVGKKYDVLGIWRERATDVRGRGLPCGHYLAEEAPEETCAELRGFFLEA
ncbi:MAG: alpha/beta hydrolase [Oscillochloridaceae bacterium]|nr:alpha/beta hydrolase [Chloroflexaceae bacterium]MDW8389979.1 alpha/beta hydrolase [Oscillochloridaceae bacterium]